MAAKRAGPPGFGGFFSLFNLPGRAFSPEALEALADVMARAGNPGAAPFGSGYVYFGQFIAHDVSRLQPPTRDATPVCDLEQLRTPALDLDSVYGKGFDDPEIAVDRLTGEMELGWATNANGAPSMKADLPRRGKGVPAIGDDRNDENLFVAQLHMRFLKLHNFFVEKLRQDVGSGLSPADLYERARQQLILHYQQAVLYDFLDTVLDTRVWEAVIHGNKGTLWSASPAETPRMPIEFSAAAFRFGHSEVRDKYAVNGALSGVHLAELFKMTGAGGFGGHIGLPQTHVVDWSLFFHSASGALPRNEALLMDVSVPLRVPPKQERIAEKNLVSGNMSGLPDGQSLVRHILREHPALAAQLQLRGLNSDETNPVMLFHDVGSPRLKPILEEMGGDHGFDTCTPLWYYILAEAQAMHAGKRLGTLGSLLVAEALRALVFLSTPSILRGERFESRYIRPTKDIHGRRYLRVIDLLNAVC